MKEVVTSAVLAIAVLTSGCQKKTEPPPAAPVSAAPAVTAPAAPAVTAPAAAAPVLSPEAYGPIRFGATVAELETIAGEKSEPLGADGGNPDCSYIKLKKFPGLNFMVEKGIVTRADAEPGLENITGLDIGDSPDAVKKKHPEATVTPHKYVPGGHDVTIAGAAKTAIVLEDDGKKIIGIRAGGEPAVSYSEGCS